MADVPFAFIRDMMAAALGVEAHLLRPPYKDAQEFDYRLSRILRADFDYKDIFSASAMHPPGADTMTPWMFGIPIALRKWSAVRSNCRASLPRGWERRRSRLSSSSGVRSLFSQRRRRPSS